MKGTKIIERVEKIAPVVFTILICSLPNDFKLSSSWKFNILVTEDVKRAEFKELYVPTIELKKLENAKGKQGL